jgi:hypothetical protein
MDAFSKSKTPEGSRDLWETPNDVFAKIGLVTGLDLCFDVCASGDTSKCGTFYWGPDKGMDALSLFPVWTPWRTGQTQYVRFALPARRKSA